MGEKQEQPQGAAAQTESKTKSLLDEVIGVTPLATRDVATDMVKELIGQVTQGVVKWDKNVSRTLDKGMAAIDSAISKQLAAIMHTSAFQKLEGTWRGMKYLVSNSKTSAQLKIKVFNLSKRELFKDLDKAVEFDQSQIFKKLYEDEFGNPGGEPYGALIGDYEFTNHPDDIATLDKLSGAAAAAFCPFISAASPELFGFKDFTELAKPRDIEKIFTSTAYTQWKSLREKEDSRFVNLVLPRVLSRLPFGKQTSPIDEFNFEEVALDTRGKSKQVPHDQYCWMNAAYVMGAKLTDAFAETGWCTAIRGAENGGKVEGLPAHVFTSDDGDLDLQCPTEVGITDRREAELSKQGFLSLCHYKNTDYAVFFGAQTTQKPKEYGPKNPNATANAAISARLPYVMATSRIAHFLKVIGRDKIGSFMEASDCQDWLTNWIANYVNADPKAKPEMRARFPLAEAKILVEEVPGKPGSYQAVAWLRPWLQMEELTTTLKMVAKIPELKK